MRLFILVDSHIDLESCDLAEGVLGEGCGSDLENTDLLIGNGGLVVLVDKGLDMSLYVLNAVCLDIVLVGEDLGDDRVVRETSLALTLVNNDVENAGGGNESVFDLLGIYVLAVREDDEVLLTSRDEEDAVLALLAVVTGAEEAVLGECLCGLLGIIVVAEHYVRTLDADLALAVLIGIENEDLIAVKGSTDTALNVIERAVYRNDGGALCDAVAVESGDAHCGEEIDDLGVDGCAARDDHLDLAAECRADLREDLLAEVDTDLAHTVAELDHTLDELFLALVLDVRPDLAVEGLKIEGNENEMLGLLLAELLSDIAKTARDEDLGADDGVTYDHNRGSEGVVGRKNADGLVAKVDIGDYRCHIRKDSVLRKHNALALARGSRCENEKRESIGIDLCVIVGIGICLKLRLARTHRCAEASLGLPCSKIYGLCLELYFGGDVFCLFLYVLIAEEEGGAGFGGCICKVRRLPFRIKGDENAADRENGKVGEHPVIAELTDDSAMLAGASHSGKLACERANVIAEIGKLDLSDLGLGGAAEGVRDLVGVRLARVLNELAHIREIEFFVKLILIHNKIPFRKLIYSF